jgi:membrane protease YdiL (CAAX protease family)
LLKIIFVILFSVNLIFSQEKEVDPTPKILNPDSKEAPKKNEKNPKLAALLGIVPGVGQVYVGNYYTGAFQLGLFMSLIQTRNHYRNKPDYIKGEDRFVEFNFNDAVVGYEMQRQGFVYNNLPYKAAFQNQDFYTDLKYPIFSETRYDRDIRLLQDKKFAEESTIIKYGSYQRSSRSTHVSDTLSNPILSTMMYSVYSSFRDAGGISEERKKETISELAFSPFNYQILKKPLVFSPILLIAAISGLSSFGEQTPILVPPSLKKDGSLYASAFVNGLSPGVGEEAFFRGYLNYSMVQSFGAAGGIGGSSVLFMLAHEGNSDAKEGRFSRLLAGAYLGFVHYQSSFDIKPGIAVHFWWNFIIGLSQLQQYKADSNYNKSQKEAYYMPIQYTFNF